MNNERTYLDYNASAPLRPEARAAMVDALAVFGNPSSVHAEGRRARAIVDAAREDVAALVGARPADVVFTSGASESNSAVVGQPWAWVAAPLTEHPSVLAPCDRKDIPRVDLAVTRDGTIDLPALERVLASRSGAGLIALQMASNETGIIQPIAAAVEIAHAAGACLSTDAVQAAGRVDLDGAAGCADYMTLSAHKLGGPKGVGALIVRDGAPVAPLVLGGGQERRRRGGTENVVGIAGFGAAARAARRDLADMPRIAGLRDRLEAEALRIAPGAGVIGHGADRLANTTCLAMPGSSAETLVIRFDLAGVAVSAGAACSSGKVGPNPVLMALGLAPELARSAIRVSLGWASTDRDVDRFLAVWSDIAIGRAQQRAVA
jgi:cysteine desulfurase